MDGSSLLGAAADVSALQQNEQQVEQVEDSFIELMESQTQSSAPPAPPSSVAQTAVAGNGDRQLSMLDTQLAAVAEKLPGADRQTARKVVRLARIGVNAVARCQFGGSSVFRQGARVIVRVTAPWLARILRGQQLVLPKFLRESLRVIVRSLRSLRGKMPLVNLRAAHIRFVGISLGEAVDRSAAGLNRRHFLAMHTGGTCHG